MMMFIQPKRLLREKRNVGLLRDREVAVVTGEDYNRMGYVYYER